LIIIAVVLTIIAAFLSLLIIIEITNLFYLKNLARYKTCNDTPFVSILVPARNEQDVIGNCLKSLLAQDYHYYEVIVIDDESTDSTPQILQSLAEENSRLKIEKGMPLPPGWLGKHWACHQLALKAKGELLLFTDADTVHRPFMLQHAVSAMTAEKADLISALPHQIMVSFIEKLVMPFSYWSTMVFLPLFIAYRTKNGWLSSGTGQFMLFRRSAYEAIGGFASIKNHVVDDVELCKRIHAQGFRWRLFDGKDIYQVRQYENFKELYEGYTKNLFAGFGNNIPVFAFVWLWLLTIFWAPPVAIIISYLLSVDTWFYYLCGICIMLSLLSWCITCAKFHFPLYIAIFYPITILMMVIFAYSSLHLSLARRATWKGRYMPGRI